MIHFSDDALQAIPGSTANEDKQALYDVLIERQNDGSLTLEGRHALAQLRDDADALMVREGQASCPTARPWIYACPRLTSCVPGPREPGKYP